MISGSIIAMRNFIEKKGRDISFYTRYKLASPSVRGSLYLDLEDTYGIIPDASFNLGLEVIMVDSIEGSRINLYEPIAMDHPDDKQISRLSYEKAIQVPRYQRITQDYLEYTRKIRVSKFTLVNYGTQAIFMGKEFFVVGLDDSDISIAVKLREVNVHLDIARMNRVEKTSFGYDTKPDIIYSNIPGHQEYITSNLLMYESGYTPSTISYITIPDDYDVKIMDQVIIGAETYRITGFDRARFKNMLFLVVDYDTDR